jgi:phosphotransferase system IIA component
LQQAARISDFAGFMLLGELIEFDATRGLFMAPRDPRTHHFVETRHPMAIRLSQLQRMTIIIVSYNRPKFQRVGTIA